MITINWKTGYWIYIGLMSYTFKQAFNQNTSHDILKINLRN